MLKRYDESVFKSLEMVFTSCTENEKFSSEWKKSKCYSHSEKRLKSFSKVAQKKINSSVNCKKQMVFPLTKRETSST